MTLYKDYALSKEDICKNPLELFAKWFELATQADIKDVEAMTLATVSADCKPSARIVLLKSFDERGFGFFTNYESRKGQEMAHNAAVALVFFWPQINKQIRIEGSVQKVSEEESDAYFAVRSRDSQLGSWASLQSSPLSDRKILEQRFAKYKKEFAEQVVTRPAYWGGYRVQPARFEFWSGQLHRLHDRIIYERDIETKEWRIFRLFP